MKKAAVSLLLLAGACTGNTSQDAARTAMKMPAAGTIAAADSMKHNDGLNDFMFAVQLRATATSGVYDVLVHDGPREANGQFTLPRGAEEYRVALRPAGDGAYTAGFSTPDDTTFLPYYGIAAEGNTLKMKYTHAYSFK